METSLNQNNPREMLFESIVRPEHHGFSILESLVSRFTYHNREEWKMKLETGLVSLNGNPVNIESVVFRGDKIVYRVENYTEPEVPTHFEMIFEDEEFLILGKPAGVPVHHTGKIFYNTFTAIVRRIFGNEELMPLHRIDRDTSGMLLFAKNRDTAARFQKHLDRILLRKIYLAIVPGIFPEEEFRCEIPLAEKSESAIKLKMYPFENGKPCLTVFRRKNILERDFGNLCGPFSLVEAELITGRKHQIRAHLAALQFPVVGDRLYSHEGTYYLKMLQSPLSEGDIQVLGSKTQMLHAHRFYIQLPYWKEPQWFESKEFSPEMKLLLDSI